MGAEVDPGPRGVPPVAGGGETDRARPGGRGRVGACALPGPGPGPDPEGASRPLLRSRHAAPRRSRRHDAYATKVSGSPADYFVRTPAGLAINYDGYTPTSRLVWEVKVGFGWFFNPKKASLTAVKLAAFDAQKTLGLAVAIRCSYLHAWSIPDRWVAGLLLSRWGGVPPVLSIPE